MKINLITANVHAANQLLDDGRIQSALLDIWLANLTHIHDVAFISYSTQMLYEVNGVIMPKDVDWIGDANEIFAIGN